jgi:integrase
MTRAKGEGSWRTRKDGRLEYALPIGKTPSGHTKRKSFYGDSKKEVLAQVEAWRKKKLLGLQERIVKLDLDELLDQWLESCTHWAQSTRHTNETFVKTYIRPYLGSYRLNDLTPVVLDGWQKILRGKNLSARVLELSYILLNQVLKRAVQLELLNRNPLSQIQRPRLVKVKRVVWTPEEASKFREAIRGDRLEALWLIAMLVGHRRSELLGLRWQDVDWQGAVLHMRHTVTFVGGKAIAREGAKTQSSLRSLKVSPEIMRALRVRQEERPFERVAALNRWREHDLVFPSEVGTPLPESTLREKLDALCLKAGVTRLTPHGLRRTYASLARLRGLDIKVVSERIGHASVVTTQDIYQQTYAEQHSTAALSSLELFGQSGKPGDLQRSAVNLRSKAWLRRQTKRTQLRKLRSSRGAEEGT